MTCTYQVEKGSEKAKGLVLADLQTIYFCHGCDFVLIVEIRNVLESLAHFY
jgi:hypothetical protein